MPTVPRVSGPTVEQAALPDARVNVRADADTFGAGAWDAVNRGATQIMRQQVAAAERERDKVDMAQVSAARTELANWEVDWFDPNNQKGVLAYQGKDALGLSSVMQQSYRDKVASLSQGLSSPEQKRAFDQMAAGYGVEVNGRVNRYALGESQKFQQQAFNAGMKSSSAIAADAARDGDMDRARKEMEYAGVLIDENARLTGEPPELVAERKRQLLSQTNAAGVSGMVSAGRQQEAEEYWRANQDDMVEADRLSAAKSIVMGRIQMDPQAASYALSASVPRQAGASVAGLPATPIAQIRTDAAAAGVPADEALAIAHLESPGFKTDARPMRNGVPLSSAHGLFQLTGPSWEQYAKDAPRDDMVAQSKAGIAYIADSRKALTQALGRAPQPHEVYMAHLFGQAGAQAVLKSPDDRPILDVVRSYDPRNARDIVANNGMAGMTVGQVKAKWQSKMGAALATVSRIPTEAPTEAQPGAEPPRQDDSIVASLPIETRIQLQSAAESQARQAQGAARADLQVKVQDSLAAFGRGESPPRLLQYADFEQAYGPMQAAREYESYRGWQQYGSDVGQLKTMPAQDMGRYLEQRRPAPGSEGYADATKRFDSLVQAAAHVQKARQEDPIAAALTAGGTAVTPLDMSNPQSLPDQLALRVAGAQQVSDTYGTPLQVFSKDEASALSGALRAMPSQQKTAYMMQLREGITDPRAFSAAMGQIAPDQPVLAVAGSIMQKQRPLTTAGGWFTRATELRQQDVASLMIEGDALLNPQASDRKEDGKSKPFPMPSGAEEKSMREAFEETTNGAFAALPSGYQLTYQAARAYYAATMARKGDFSGVYDAGKWEESIRAATGGVTNYNSRGNVLLPWGMPEDEFDGAAQKAFGETLQRRGMKPDELTNYGLQTLSDGRYLVTTGTGWLRDSTGEKIVVDLNRSGGP